MSTAETLGSENPFQDFEDYFADGSIDPIELAKSALVKLKAAGHSGVIYGKEVQINDGEKVARLDDYRPPKSDLLSHPTPLREAYKPGEEAFAEIYRTHQTKVRNFAAKLVGFSQADDVVNETFSRAWEKLDTFTDQGYGISPWLMRIAYNFCMDILRKGKDDLWGDPEQHWDNQSVEEPFLQEIIDEIDTEEILGGLSESQRQLFIALGLRELSLKEYAEELGIPEGALKSRLFRARSKLKQNNEPAAKETSAPACQAPALSRIELNNLSPKQVELFNKYYPFIPAIVYKVTWGLSVDEREEAVGAGYEGLVRGVMNYDPAKVSEDATKGNSYVYDIIRGHIRRWMRDYFGRDTINRDKTVRRKPGVISGTADSFDAPLANQFASAGEEEKTLKDIVIGNDGREHSEHIAITSDVAAIVNTFPAREKEIFVRRFGLGQTQTQIAHHLGISQMHVSRLISRMLEHIETVPETPLLEST